MHIVVFVEGCLNEAQRAATEVHHQDCDSLTVSVAYGEPVRDRHTTCTCGIPTRILRSIDVQRLILAEHRPDFLDGDWDVVCPVCYAADGPMHSPCVAVRALASGFADRPGWCEEWAPQG